MLMTVIVLAALAAWLLYAIIKIRRHETGGCDGDCDHCKDKCK